MATHNTVPRLIAALLCLQCTLVFAQNQEKADSLKRVFEVSNFNDEERLRLLENIAFNETDPYEIQTYAEQLIREASVDSSFQWIGNGYIQRGHAYRLLGNNDVAIQSYFIALENHQKVGYSIGKGISNVAIGDTYSAIGDSKSAIEFYNKGIFELRKNEDLIQLGSALFNAGDEYLTIEILDSALLYFDEAQRIFTQENYEIGQAYCKGNMGLAYAQQGKFQQAEKSLFEATNILERLEDTYGISSYQIFMADVYLQTDYLMGALIHANIAFENASKHDLKEQIRDASLKLSEIYEAMSKAGKAISFLKTFIQYSDSLTNPNVISRISQIRRDYEEAQKQTNEPIEAVEFTRTRPTYYALIIGVNDYHFNNDRLVDLGHPVQDAQKLKETLTNSYTFENEHIVFLENPTRSKIINALEAISATITENDNLVVFYAGHGVWDENLEIGYWLPADATMSSKANWLSNSRVRDYISGIKTKHTLLITDACFSGSIFRTRSVQDENAMENTLQVDGFAKVYRLPSRKAMTSGTLNTVPDQSKFMQFLLRRLNDNNKRYVTARQIFTQVETAVINNTRNVPQYGTIQNAGDEGGDFIFIRKR